MVPRLAAFATDDSAYQQLLDIKHKLSKASDGQVNEISMAEYMQYLRNRNILDNNPVMITTILVQFFKRTLRNEGIEGDHDDIFRPVYTALRTKTNR